MASTWLSIWAPPVGFNGSYIMEDTRLQPDFVHVLFIGVCQKTAYLRRLGHTFDSRPDTMAILHRGHQTIGDYTLNKSKARKFQAQPEIAGKRLHHFAQATAPCAFSRLIRPVCGSIILFMSDVGGMDNAARLVASWIVQAKDDETGRTPRLFIVPSAQTDKASRISLLIRTEVIDQLRKTSPQRPYSMSEASRMMTSCFCDVTLVLENDLEDALGALESGRVAPKSADFITLMCAHLRDTGSQPFNLIRALSNRYPLPSCATSHALSFVRRLRSEGLDGVYPLALLLVQEAARSPLAAHCEPQVLFDSRFSVIAYEIGRELRDDEFGSRLRVEYLRLLRRSHILAQPPEPPIVGAMSEWMKDIGLCTSCCHVTNTRQLTLQPKGGRVRVLAMEHQSVLSTVCLLRELRARLHGPLHDYIDIVAGAGRAVDVVKDIFIEGLDTQQSLERHESRRREFIQALIRTKAISVHNRMPGSLQVILASRRKLLTSWRRSAPVYISHPVPFLQQVQDSCGDWGHELNVIGLNSLDEPSSLAARLIAGLFYAQIIEREESTEVFVQCRLGESPHQAAVLRALHTNSPCLADDITIVMPPLQDPTDASVDPLVVTRLDSESSSTYSSSLSSGFDLGLDSDRGPDTPSSADSAEKVIREIDRLHGVLVNINEDIAGCTSSMGRFKSMAISLHCASDDSIDSSRGSQKSNFFA
ncbi:hypothetical protein Micbo1qcDRAFT_181019 [Microdochium bolleyi]|uniref:Uncharacterized protein n=1 Tax=Microdochium bolleyi TaxID=196109 RepID=A0A136IJQ6_9PEZI|nr:hypothetical protein Micbo1qcDRAFT_181019 [Microdochium bolleyi]